MDQQHLESVERRLTAALTAWGMASSIAGAALALAGHRTQRRQLMRFGRQTLMWGAVDVGIATIGALVRSRRDMLTDEDVEQQTARLVRLLLVNAAADVVYVAGGLHVIAHARPGRGGEPERTSFRLGRGDGWAILIQGGFLLVLDTVHALELTRDD